jgi:hypothetical protein
MLSTEYEHCETCNVVLSSTGKWVPKIDYNGAWHLYCSEACRDGVISGEEPDIVY